MSHWTMADTPLETALRLGLVKFYYIWSLSIDCQPKEDHRLLSSVFWLLWHLWLLRLHNAPFVAEYAGIHQPNLHLSVLLREGKMVSLPLMFFTPMSLKQQSFHSFCVISCRFFVYLSHLWCVSQSDAFQHDRTACSREKNTASEQSTQSKISTLNVCECVYWVEYLKKRTQMMHANNFVYFQK